MASNTELMDKVKAVESEYGSSDDWPESVIEELNKLANRENSVSVELVGQ